MVRRAGPQFGRRGRPRQFNLPEQPRREHGDGDATSSGWGCQAECKRNLVTPGGWGPRLGQTTLSALRLRDRRIGEREVVKERFGRPLARLVSRLTSGEVGRRPEAGRCGGEA